MSTSQQQQTTNNDDDDDDGSNTTGGVVEALSKHVASFPYPLPEGQREEGQEEGVLDNLVPGWAEVVLLGESTHGTAEFYTLRRKLTRHLVQNRGFTAILLEAEWPDLYNVNIHLTQSKSPYPSVSAALQQIQGHGKHMWQNAETVTMLEWIRQFNASQGFRPDSMVYVFGMDCQQIYRSLSALYGALAGLDFTLCSELKGRLSFFHGYQENEYEYTRQTIRGIGSEQIPEILQKILSEFQWKHMDSFKSKIPADRWLDLLNIEQNLEVLVNAEEYYRKKMLEPPGSNASWNTRDQHMALTVGRIRERLQIVTKMSSSSSSSSSDKSSSSLTKVIVWAHNSHIGNSAATARGGADFTRNENWNLGQMVRHVTDRSFALGFDTSHGTVTALKNGGGGDDNDDDATTKTYVLNAPLENSTEHLFHQVCERLKCDAFYLPLNVQGLSNNPQLLEALRLRMPQRYVGVHYHPENELRSHYTDGSLIGQYDALVFVDKTSALPVLSPKELQEGLKASTPVGAKSNAYGVRRLMQEYVKLGRQPIPQIRVASEEDNLYMCHFLLTFNWGVYAGGEYHGRLTIPKEYPMAPPGIYFFTPSGRFEVGERVCVSFSDYHPELWSPLWGIESVLVGLQSFMQEECPEGVGSIMTSTSNRRKLAEESHEFNLKNDLYQKVFGSNSRTQSFAGVAGEEKKDDEDLPCCRYCRIPGGDLISPCECKGGSKWAHMECLAKWQYQAILSQSTHRKYQTGIEKYCNVCGTEFRTKVYSREKLVLSFTGAEMANMIEPGCLLVATEKSSKYNVQLMEQYEDVRERLSHWTHSIFLISACMTSPDGKRQTILGLSLTNEIGEDRIKRNSKVLTKLGLPPNIRGFIGGPCSPDVPHFLLLVQTSSLTGSCPHPHCCKILEGTAAPPYVGDLSLWYAPGYQSGTIQQVLGWAHGAVIEVRVYWGCATWDRIQMLGEIARGGWGLANGHVEAWIQPNWRSTVDRAIFAGANDFSRKYDTEP